MELTPEQQVMENRFSQPYNWKKGPHTRHIRQKGGIWALALERAGDIQRKRVLDAGCGDGWYSHRMALAGARVTGIDYSERGVEMARQAVPDVEFRHASVLDLPFSDESFDVVFCFQVIEHIPPADVPRAAQELVRVTKKGGRLVVSVPSIRRKMSAAHFQHFTDKQLASLFAPYTSEHSIIGQDRRNLVIFMIERLIENRWYAVRWLGKLFNNTAYLWFFNRTNSSKGDNLILSAVR
jgi:2-polyprenyl-3-methyl-5-hydroxy-6-metoxy-1,4-benzoquinol methylase